MREGRRNIEGEGGREIDRWGGKSQGIGRRRRKEGRKREAQTKPQTPEERGTRRNVLNSVFGHVPRLASGRRREREIKGDYVILEGRLCHKEAIFSSEERLGGGGVSLPVH